MRQISRTVQRRIIAVGRVEITREGLLERGALHAPALAFKPLQRPDAARRGRRRLWRAGLGDGARLGPKRETPIGRALWARKPERNHGRFLLAADFDHHLVVAGFEPDARGAPVEVVPAIGGVDQALAAVEKQAISAARAHPEADRPPPLEARDGDVRREERADRRARPEQRPRVYPAVRERRRHYTPAHLPPVLPRVRTFPHRRISELGFGP